MPRVVISGGSGLIGQALCRRLQEKGYEVAILSRNKKAHGQAVPHFMWNVDHQEIDREALNKCDFIIHLAGVNIGAGRWTRKRKLAISDSRIKSARLIHNNIDKYNSSLKAFISASAVGYYGARTSQQILSESDPAAEDFLGKTCEKWEEAADKLTESGIRTVKIRTGIVLSKEGGALSKLLIPVKLGLASAMGTGKQLMPWIHLDDLCDIYIHAMENETMSGPYNAVAPEYIANKDFTSKLARALHKPFWFPNIPSLVMKLLFGEMSVMLLTGSRISSERIQNAGYQFRFPNLDAALADLFTK